MTLAFDTEQMVSGLRFVHSGTCTNGRVKKPVATEVTINGIAYKFPKWTPELSVAIEIPPFLAKSIPLTFNGIAHSPSGNVSLNTIQVFAPVDVTANPELLRWTPAAKYVSTGGSGGGSPENLGKIGEEKYENTWSTKAIPWKITMEFLAVTVITKLRFRHSITAICSNGQCKAPQATTVMIARRSYPIPPWSSGLEFEIVLAGPLLTDNLELQFHGNMSLSTLLAFVQISSTANLVECAATKYKATASTGGGSKVALSGTSSSKWENSWKAERTEWRLAMKYAQPIQIRGVRFRHSTMDTCSTGKVKTPQAKTVVINGASYNFLPWDPSGTEFDIEIVPVTADSLTISFDGNVSLTKCVALTPLSAPPNAITAPCQSYTVSSGADVSFLEAGPTAVYENDTRRHSITTKLFEVAKVYGFQFRHSTSDTCSSQTGPTDPALSVKIGDRSYDFPRWESGAESIVLFEGRTTDEITLEFEGDISISGLRAIFVVNKLGSDKVTVAVESYRSSTTGGGSPSRLGADGLSFLTSQMECSRTLGGLLSSAGR